MTSIVYRGIEAFEAFSTRLCIRYSSIFSPKCCNAMQCRQQTNATHTDFQRLFNRFHVRYEDDTEKANDKKAAQLRNKVKRNWAQMIMLAFWLVAGSGAIDHYFQERGRLRRQQSFQNGHVTIYEADRWSLMDTCLGIPLCQSCVQPTKDRTGGDETGRGRLWRRTGTACRWIFHLFQPGLLFHQPLLDKPSQRPIKADQSDSWSFFAMCCVTFLSYDIRYAHPQDSESGQKFRKKVKKFRGLSPMGRQAVTSRNGALAHLPLSVECFIVSRGWQIDQAQLNKAISRLEGINFVRIQMVNTINRVIENIRPHNDVVLIHIGPTELSEACHRWGMRRPFPACLSVGLFL